MADTVKSQDDLLADIPDGGVVSPGAIRNFILSGMGSFGGFNAGEFAAGGTLPLSFVAAYSAMTYGLNSSVAASVDPALYGVDYIQVQVAGTYLVVVSFCGVFERASGTSNVVLRLLQLPQGSSSSNVTGGSITFPIPTSTPKTIKGNCILAKFVECAANDKLFLYNDFTSGKTFTNYASDFALMTFFALRVK